MAASSQVRPSYKSGFARSVGESLCPELWRGLVAAYAPALGVTGYRLVDQAGIVDGTLHNMELGDWLVGEKGYALNYTPFPKRYVDLGTRSRSMLTGYYWSMSFWIKSTSTELQRHGSYNGSSAMGVIVDLNRGATYPLSGSIYVATYSPGTSSSLLGYTADTNYNDGRWHLVTVTNDLKTNTLEVYVDLKSWPITYEGRNSGPNGLLDLGVNFFLGALNLSGTSNSSITGQIGTSLFYNRLLNSGDVKELYNNDLAPFQLRRPIYAPAPSGATATVTGSVIDSPPTEEDMVDGLQTIIVTITGESLKAPNGAPIGDQSDMDALFTDMGTWANPSAPGGFSWNDLITSAMDNGNVSRDSDTQFTITLPALPTYDIDTPETINVNVPATLTVGGAFDIPATPTFDITPVAAPINVTIGAGGENDIATALNVVLGAGSFFIGTAPEGDTANPLNVLLGDTLIELGSASENDIATALNVVLGAGSFFIGTAPEGDTANPLNVTLGEVILQLGSASENDIATALNVTLGDGNYFLGTAPEGDTANALIVDNPLTLELGTASELDTAGALIVDNPQILELGAASENDIATALNVTLGAGNYFLGTAPEGDTANPLILSLSSLNVQLGTAQETDTANLLIVAGPQTFELGNASELDTAGTLLVISGTAGMVSIRNVTISGPFAVATIDGP